jgi:2-methylcitrate dehydratase PrpD
MSSYRTDSQIIATFAADFDSSGLDEKHVRQCGRALADTMAVAIAAQSEPAVRRAHGYIESLTPSPLDARGGSLPGRLPPSREPPYSTASRLMCSISTTPRLR